MSRTRIVRNYRDGGRLSLMPYVLEYDDGGEWLEFGGYNTETSAAWIAHSVFGAPRPGS